jgi:hypothetical protein
MQFSVCGSAALNSDVSNVGLQLSVLPVLLISF